MKDQYNDYKNTVRNYLRDYNYFKIMIANMEEDREDRLNSLREHSVSIARYGDATGGGSGELNQTEAAVSQRMKIEEDIHQIEANLQELYSVISKIDRALSALGNLERQAIAGYYFEKKSWDEVGIDIDCTGKTARAKAGRGIDDMAYMIFGKAARPRQLSFCFFKVPSVDNLE